MSEKNMGRLAQDMKREIIAIISRLKDPRLGGGSALPSPGLSPKVILLLIECFFF